MTSREERADRPSTIQRIFLSKNPSKNPSSKRRRRRTRDRPRRRARRRARGRGAGGPPPRGAPWAATTSSSRRGRRPGGRRPSRASRDELREPLRAAQDREVRLEARLDAILVVGRDRLRGATGAPARRRPAARSSRPRGSARARRRPSSPRSCGGARAPSRRCRGSSRTRRRGRSPPGCPRRPAFPFFPFRQAARYMRARSRNSFSSGCFPMRSSNRRAASSKWRLWKSSMAFSYSLRAAEDSRTASLSEAGALRGLVGLVARRA